MSDRDLTPRSVEGLYQQLAVERAGRARAALACERTVERLFAQSAVALEDAAARRGDVHRARGAAAGLVRRAGRGAARGRGAVRGSSRPHSRPQIGLTSGWRVLDLDLDGETAHVVDALLAGGEDGRPQAEAIARDYLSTVGGTAGAGTHARILEADLALPAYPIGQLVGDLPDPATYSPPRASTPTANTDPYKRIGAREYFERLAGIVVPRDGLVCCPAAGHEDHNPSCSVGTSPDQGWCCHAGVCGARGAIYDLAGRCCSAGPGAQSSAATHSGEPAPT
jgi:hypothetical protein